MTLLCVSCLVDSTATQDDLNKVSTINRYLNPECEDNHNKLVLVPGMQLKLYLDVDYPDQDTFEYHQGTFHYKMRSIVDEVIKLVYGQCFSVKEGNYAISRPYKSQMCGFAPQVYLNRMVLNNRYYVNYSSIASIHSCIKKR